MRGRFWDNTVPRARIEKIKKRYRDFQKISGLIGVSGFLKRMVYSSCDESLVCKDLHDINPKALKNDLVVKPVERSHIADLGALRRQVGLGGNNPNEQLEQYMNNGCKGLMGLVNNEVIGYIWWGNRRTNFDFDPEGYGNYVKQIALKPDEVYSLDLYIAPQFRGRGNARHFLNKYFHALSKLGYRFCYGFVHKANRAAYMLYMITGCTDKKTNKVRRFFTFVVLKDQKISWDKHGIKWLFRASEVYAGKKRK